MVECDKNASFAVVWQKCYLGNVDGEQIVWVCKTREQSQSVATFLAIANPHLSTIDPNAPRYMRFATRPATPSEVAGCACLIKRLREQNPSGDDDALKLSRLVLENHAVLGIELLQEGYIAQFTSPARTSPRGVSGAAGWRDVLQKLDVVAANTSHLPKISEAVQGTQGNTFRMMEAVENAPAMPNASAKPTISRAYFAHIAEVDESTVCRWLQNGKLAESAMTEEEAKKMRADGRRNAKASMPDESPCPPSGGYYQCAGTEHHRVDPGHDTCPQCNARVEYVPRG